mgnify:FL=1
MQTVKQLLLIYSQLGCFCLLVAGSNGPLAQKEKSYAGPAFKKPLTWSNFSFNSTKEEAFWIDSPDWTGIKKIPKFRRNRNGKEIDSNTSNEYSGYARQIDQEWQLRTVFLVKNGWVIKTKSWDKFGRPRTQRYYKNGKLHGPWIGWHENGQKQIEFTWANGVPLGESTSWHQNGNLAKKGQYQKGKMHGEWITYQFDGTEKTRLIYNFGKIVSE